MTKMKPETPEIIFSQKWILRTNNITNNKYARNTLSINNSATPAKGVVRVTAARVQIPASPLKPLRINVLNGFSLPSRRNKNHDKSGLIIFY